jgi:hypothetical protein
MSASSFFQNVKRIMNGFKILYYDVKKVSVMIKDNNLSWKSVQSSQEHPKIFQKSTVSHRFTYSEVQFTRLTIRSAKKVGLFFFVQLVPIIGYLPIAVALMFPKHILTEHFWSDEQKQLFLQQDWEMRRKHSKDVVQLWKKDGTVPSIDKSLSSTTITDKNNYLRLLLQSNGFFMNTPSWLLSVLPLSYKMSLLNQRAYEIINDDYLLRKENLFPEEQAKAKNVDIPRYELQKALVTRGFPPDANFATLNSAWLKNSKIKLIEEKIIQDENISGSDSYLNFEVSNSLSSKEQLLLLIAWNSVDFDNNV